MSDTTGGKLVLIIVSCVVIYTVVATNAPASVAVVGGLAIGLLREWVLSEGDEDEEHHPGG